MTWTLTCSGRCPDRWPPPGHLTRLDYFRRLRHAARGHIREHCDHLQAFDIRHTSDSADFPGLRLALSRKLR